MQTVGRSRTSVRADERGVLGAVTVECSSLLSADVLTLLAAPTRDGGPNNY